MKFFVGVTDNQFEEERVRYSKETTIRPRLGQGTQYGIGDALRGLDVAGRYRRRGPGIDDAALRQGERHRPEAPVVRRCIGREQAAHDVVHR